MITLHASRFTLLALCPLLFALCASGCTRFAARQKAAVTRVAVTETKLTEEIRANTTAAVDTLVLAPTNRHTTLALDFTKRSQLMLGMPVERIDVEAILRDERAALTLHQVRAEHQAELVKERVNAANELAKANDKLAELGRQAEAANNASLVKRIYVRLGLLGSIAAVVAACVFFPVLIPIFGQLLGWLVSKVPKLAGALGVVSKSAFDSVVKGVGAVRTSLKERASTSDRLLGDTEMLKLVDDELLKSTDASDRKLIESRRAVLAV